MISIASALGAVALGLWLCLLISRRAFRRDWVAPPPLRLADLPATLAIVPALRPETGATDRMRGALRALLAQEYPGPLSILVVGQSGAGWIEDLKALIQAEGEGRCALATAAPIGCGWNEGAWALRCTFETAPDLAAQARYFFLAKPNLVLGRDTLARLAARAEVCRLDLISLLARRDMTALIERVLAPALLFFFRLRFPLGEVNNPTSPVAAAGDAMLIRITALQKIIPCEQGGATALPRRVDIQTLAGALKRNGPIHLDITEAETTIAAARSLRDLWRQIGGEAVAELGGSPLRLAREGLGVALAFLVPPALALFGSGLSAAFGLAGWIALCFAFLPALRYCRVPILWAPLLPLLALFHLAATIGAALANVSDRRPFPPRHRFEERRG